MIQNNINNNAITVSFDGTIDIAKAYGVKATTWKNTRPTWSELVNNLSQTKVTGETAAEYAAMSRPERVEVKDIGGYVGGYLDGGVRKQSNVKYRQLLTLDIDNGTDGVWEKLTKAYGNACVMHTSHSHTPENPRWRIVMPLARKCDGDEYQAVGRMVARHIGEKMFDTTTFDTNRLMFWPSTPKDIEYGFHFQDGPWLNPDDVLSEYRDWRDMTEWPLMNERKEGAASEHVRRGNTVQDPLEKGGLIGAFCNAHSITDVMETYLKDEYRKAEGDRYTYVKGSTYGGVCTYDDKFAYSHHSTDPTCGKLCNSYDLVRIHKFGDTQDSVDKMNRLVMDDEKASVELAAQRITEAGGTVEEWMSEIERNKKGEALSNSKNIELVMTKDSALKNLFARNQFDGMIYKTRRAPWDTDDSGAGKPIREEDFAGLKYWLDTRYGINNDRRTDGLLIIEAQRNAYHPVRKWLESLPEWDGVRRCETLFIDYLGAPDSEYTRLVARKMMAGAVMRVMKPGIKYDLVPVLMGSQGIGKSMFCSMLGGKWFSDSPTSMQDKSGMESIRGVWIQELSELSAMKRAEIENVKAYISRQVDRFRPAYGHVVEEHPRECIFIGTTNTDTFLRDDTGNRRFLPIDCDIDKAIKSIAEDMKVNLDQIWAEAKEIAKTEKLYLSREEEKEANGERDDHTAFDERISVVEAYLDRKLPMSWDDMYVGSRREWLANQDDGVCLHTMTCAMEVWQECFGNTAASLDKNKAKEINDLLSKIPGWHRCDNVKRFKLYGVCRAFERDSVK